MTILIEELTFDTIIGILPHERVTPQKVIVNVELDYEYKKSLFINYATLAELIENDLQKTQYNLIEDAILSLHVKIKEEFPQITSIKLKISKPTILAQCGVSVCSTRKY